MIWISSPAEEDAAMNVSAPVVPLAFTTLETLRQPIEPKFIKTREGWRTQRQPHMVNTSSGTRSPTSRPRRADRSHSVRGIVQIGDMVRRYRRHHD